MSTRAMARQYSSGGRGSSGWDSLDLLGGKARAANKAADADMTRTIKLQEQLAKIEKELELAKHANALNLQSNKFTSEKELLTERARLDKELAQEKFKLDKKAANQASRNDVYKSKGQTPKQGRQLVDADTEMQRLKYAAQIAARQDPKYGGMVKAGEHALAAMPAFDAAVKGTQKLNVGESVAFPQWQDLSTMIFGDGGRMNSSSTTFGNSVDKDGNIVRVPDSVEERSQGSAQWDFPLDPNKRQARPPSTAKRPIKQPANKPALATIGIGPNNPFGLSPTGIDPNYDAPTETSLQTEFRGIAPHALEMLQDLPGFPRRLGQATIDNVIRPSGDFLKYLLFGAGRQQ